MRLSVNFSYRTSLSEVHCLLLPPNGSAFVHRKSPFISHNCDQAGQRLLILNDYLIEPISRAFRKIGAMAIECLWADNRFGQWWAQPTWLFAEELRDPVLEINAEDLLREQRYPSIESIIMNFHDH